jgi:hypothetical protein
MMYSWRQQECIHVVVQNSRRVVVLALAVAVDVP